MLKIHLRNIIREINYLKIFEGVRCLQLFRLADIIFDIWNFEREKKKAIMHASHYGGGKDKERKFFSVKNKIAQEKKSQSRRRLNCAKLRLSRPKYTSIIFLN